MGETSENTENSSQKIVLCTVVTPKSFCKIKIRGHAWVLVTSRDRNFSCHFVSILLTYIFYLISQRRLPNKCRQSQKRRMPASVFHVHEYKIFVIKLTLKRCLALSRYMFVQVLCQRLGFQCCWFGSTWLLTKLLYTQHCSCSKLAFFVKQKCCETCYMLRQFRIC